VHEPATALYAFCRVADDLIDEGGDPGVAMAGLRGRLDAIYAGRPLGHAADRAVAASAVQQESAAGEGGGVDADGAARWEAWG